MPAPLKPFDEIVKEATALHYAVSHLPKPEAVHAICDALIRARHDAHVEAIDLMREALEKPELVGDTAPGVPPENSAG